jgi:hypothetical protein
MSAVGRRGPATEAETGRACPYCRFPLKQGVEVVQCAFCSSFHHGDCWDDNRGCAVVACPGGPGAATAAAPQQQPTQVMAPPPAPPVAAPPAQPVSRGPWLTAAVIVLALAVAGAAAAFVFMKPADDDDGSSRETPAAQESGSEGSEAAPPADDPEPPPAEPTSAALPDVSRAEMQADIESLLLTWHEHIVAGDYRAAWDLLTPRKRAQKLREEGYAKWSEGQASLGRYLDPSGLRASIEEVDEESGVVTVTIRGMDWSAPGSSCSEWSGITWVKYEGGRWLYEPGYSMTAARRAEWEPRQTETLGWDC